MDEAQPGFAQLLPIEGDMGPAQVVEAMAGIDPQSFRYGPDRGRVTPVGQPAALRANIVSHFGIDYGG